MPASILEEVGHLFDEAALTRNTATRLSCPSCGSAHVAQVLGDNGGISYVCTACGHSWS
jgi:transposase-like protein